MKSNKVKWVVAKLGEDFNWWVTETSAEGGNKMSPSGILDPRQVAHLVQMLEEYQPHGLHSEQLSAAFQMFALESEIAEGQARLSAVAQPFGDGDTDLFALPAGSEDDQGAYEAFLDSLIAAHIRKLNTTHEFAQPCTAEEMNEELQAIDGGRYFNAEVIHPFDEINEILEWSPAEWDDASSS